MSVVLMVALVWCSTLSEGGVMSRNDRWFVPWRSVTLVSTRVLTETRAATCVHLHSGTTPCDIIQPSQTNQRDIQTSTYNIEPSISDIHETSDLQPTLFMGKQRYNWAFLGLETTFNYEVTLTRQVIDPGHVVTLQCYTSDMPLCEEDIMLPPNNDNISLTKQHHTNVIADEVTMATKTTTQINSTTVDDQETTIKPTSSDVDYEPTEIINESTTAEPELTLNKNIIVDEEETSTNTFIVNQKEAVTMATESTIYQETSINEATDEFNTEKQIDIEEDVTMTTLLKMNQGVVESDQLAAVTMATDTTVQGNTNDVNKEIVDSEHLMEAVAMTTESTMQDDMVTITLIVGDNPDKKTTVSQNLILAVHPTYFKEKSENLRDESETTEENLERSENNSIELLTTPTSFTV